MHRWFVAQKQDIVAQKQDIVRGNPSAMLYVWHALRYYVVFLSHGAFSIHLVFGSWKW